MYQSQRVVHPIAPVFNADSKVLILGSFPSVASREQCFFYGHARNRFWPLIARLLQSEVPSSIEEKCSLLLRHRLALWDVVQNCNIVGSSDASIQNVVPNDLSIILRTASIQCIAANGACAARLYRKYCLSATGKEILLLPSTSPANAAYSLDALYEVWHAALSPYV